MLQPVPKPEGFDKFDRLMRGLVHVKKSELDTAERKYQAAKKRRKAKRKYN
jgi:hypothetical protein